MVVVETVVVVVWGVVVVGLAVVEGSRIVVSCFDSMTGAAVVVIFKFCPANDSRLVIDRFKRGRVTTSKRAIKRDPQLHETLLTRRRGRCPDC